MRFLLKILFAPILAVLAVVTWFFVFVVSLSSGILCIPAAILGFFGLFIIFVDSVSYGAGLLGSGYRYEITEAGEYRKYRHLSAAILILILQYFLKSVTIRYS